VKNLRSSGLPILLLLALLWSTAASAQSAVARPRDTSQGNQGVRACLYVPGVSVPARMPAGLMNPSRLEASPPFKPPPVTRVSAEKTAEQMRVLEGLSNAVRDHYVYADFRGRDWKALTAKYRAMVERGLSDADFYAAMQALISELGDEHSYFQSPAQIPAEKAEVESRYNFVGIGALFSPIPGTEHAAIMTVFPGGPAAQAGLRSHDLLLSVEGGPIREKSGISRTLGVEGSQVRITVQHPGERPRELRVTRRRVTGMLPVDYCMVPRTRIGYLFLPTLLDKTMAEQVREALRRMTAEGPLEGLVLDNRMNGGGLGSVARAILGMFTGGAQGAFVSRTSRAPLVLQAEDIGGSQRVPLVVLVDRNTVSFGEIMSGVLQAAGRARVVGGRTLGNVEELRAYSFRDGSRAWLASETYEPRGLANGAWEGKGIVPDVSVPTRWELFTEANDPALAKAVELLKKK
jgi:carboxyl-terminal processing protease